MYVYAKPVTCSKGPKVPFAARVTFVRLIKGARSYFSKFSFIFDLKDHHTKDVDFKLQFIFSNRLDLASNFVYCSCLYKYSM